jgi:hypothetical protein
MRLEVCQQRRQLGVQDQEPLGQGRRGVGLHHPRRLRPQHAVGLASSDQAVTAAGQARIDPQYEHAFVG